MKKLTTYSLCLFLLLLIGCTDGGQPGTLAENPDSMVPQTELDHSILVFSKTSGFRHSSIEAGVEAISSLGEENDVFVFATEDASVFNESDLGRFDAVVFVNTTQTLFDEEQRSAFQQYIQSGGGFAGVHSATDTEYEWPWYNRLVGAYFANHPRNQTATLLIQDQDHPATEMLPEVWEKYDEWYNFRDLNEDVQVLIALDAESYEGSGHPDFHPISWYHEFDGGRAFYTGLGHTEESYTENDLFLQHLWGGIEYAMGVR